MGAAPVHVETFAPSAANDNMPPLRRTVHGPGVDEPLTWYEGSGTADRRYLITDNQGTVIAEDGAGVVRYAYGPYGEPDTWTGSRFRYTGQIALPEAQLYHYKARAYDSLLGRFLQTDPVGSARDVIGRVEARSPSRTKSPAQALSTIGEQPRRYPVDRLSARARKRRRAAAKIGG
jgi:RHS repeat-associated protein